MYWAGYRQALAVPEAQESRFYARITRIRKSDRIARIVVLRHFVTFRGFRAALWVSLTRSQLAGDLPGQPGKLLEAWNRARDRLEAPGSLESGPGPPSGRLLEAWNRARDTFLGSQGSQDQEQAHLTGLVAGRRCLADR